ncbi:MAG: ATP-binding cassette domain-containing protein [Caldilineaceae bacterium]|nr:ATP-binding cassette domain-containing protein [Caldilineaceae bacterium]
MNTPPVIQLSNLRKIYTVHEREAGLLSAVRSLVHRRTRQVRAVDGITFSVQPGEVVGFLGPNGAGKTTTLKMLSGLLHPTDGDATVLGFHPWQRDRDYLRRMTLVMGQRNQLVWDIPVIDSFELNRVVYRIPDHFYRETLAELTELLELGTLLQKPVRNLSLGERMKCEIGAALLHRPAVLFLDEPTIGLDVTMQRRIRTFVAEYNHRHEATVLLTSHYMADVEALCERVIVIHHGQLLYDGGLAGLVARFSSYKTLSVKMANGAVDFDRYGEVVSRAEGMVTLRVPKAETASITGRLLAEVEVTDLTVEDPPIEEVIEAVFNQGNENAQVEPPHA